MMQVLVYGLCRPPLKYNSAKTHGTDYSLNLNISAEQQLDQAFYGSNFKLAHWELKTVPILEIKGLVFMLHSIKQGAYFTHPVETEIF